MNQNYSKCFSCNQKEVEYLQIEDIQQNYALCRDCFSKKNDKSQYLETKTFLVKYEEKISKEFPNLYKLLKFKQNTDKLILWEQFIKPYLDDAPLLFITNKKYTQQNFQLLGNFFQKQGKVMEKLAIHILNFFNANRFFISNSVYFKEQNQNVVFKEKYQKYLSEIIEKQQFKEIIRYIENDLKNIFTQIPENFQKVGIEFKNDDYDQKELKKYFGYLDLIDLKNGKGILKNKDIIYYGIFEHDIFIYGVKFEQISPEEGQFFFGSFFKEEIQGQGKMIAYKLDINQIIYQEYEGNYENGLRNGQGQFIWKSNNKTLIYEGSWNQNLQHGNGIIDQNGNKKNVQYEQGKLIEDVQPQNNFQNNKKNNEKSKLFLSVNQLQQQQGQNQQAQLPNFQQPLNIFAQPSQNDKQSSQSQIRYTLGASNTTQVNTLQSQSLQKYNLEFQLNQQQNQQSTQQQNLQLTLQPKQIQDIQIAQKQNISLNQQQNLQQTQQQNLVLTQPQTLQSNKQQNSLNQQQFQQTNTQNGVATFQIKNLESIDNRISTLQYNNNNSFQDKVTNQNNQQQPFQNQQLQHLGSLSARQAQEPKTIQQQISFPVQFNNQFQVQKNVDGTLKQNNMNIQNR